MNIDNLNRIADGLAGAAGGYNAKGLLTALPVALAGGFLLGGLLGTWFGYLFLVPPLCLGLLGAGFVAYVRFRGEGARGGPGQFGQPVHGGEIEQSGDPPSVPQQTPTPPPSSIPDGIPDGLSRLEHQIMEHVGRGGGTLSVSAIAAQLDVPRETVQDAIEGLASRGIISLE